MHVQTRNLAYGFYFIHHLNFGEQQLLINARRLFFPGIVAAEAGEGEGIKYLKQ